MTVEAITFYLLAYTAGFTALMVVLYPNPVHSALFLIATMICLAGLYLLLNAQFIALVHILVYAGAIMVLFLFVIMLLNVGRVELAPRKLLGQKFVGSALAAAFLFEMGGITRIGFKVTGARLGEYSPEKVNALGNTQLVGKLLFTDYLLPFEVTSILIFVAVIGVLILARKEWK